MNDTVADEMHLSAVPIADRHLIQAVKVLVIAIHKQRGKWLVVQPVQPMPFLFGVVPEAEIAADDDIVFLAHLLLFGENIGAEPGGIPVGVSSYEDHIATNFQKVLYHIVRVSSS